ncbi:MAG: hypothetical protein HYZ37_12690 [Candidatus Solibacter usitatus]|nr:hypothetical protein [Candidatus Solibacter usitatus]
MKQTFAGLLVLAATPAAMLADFSYTQTTRMTGGALAAMGRAMPGLGGRANQPTNSTTLYKGNKMAHISDQSADIWDLDTDTITHINFKDQSYSRITLAQMKQAMEQMMQSMKGKTNEAGGQMNVNMRANVTDTGKRDVINGVQAREVILTMAAQMTDRKSKSSTEMQTMMALWLADDVPGYAEVRDFQQRMAAKMAGDWQSLASGQAGAMAGFGGGMSSLAAEAHKMQGIHIRTIMKMGTGLDPAMASQISAPPASAPGQQGPSGGQVAERVATQTAENEANNQVGRLAGRLPGSLGGALGGLGGGLGGLGRRKQQKQTPPPPDPQEQAAQQQAAQQAGAQMQSGVVMEMVTDTTGFSSAAVDAAKFSVPAGFKETEHPMLKSSNRR